MAGLLDAGLEEVQRLEDHGGGDAGAKPGDKVSSFGGFVSHRHAQLPGRVQLTRLCLAAILCHWGVFLSR